MSAPVQSFEASLPQFIGLRMRADEFFQIPDDGHNYELIDGVVTMTPSPAPKHQAVLMEITTQIGMFLRDHATGQALPEIDVHLGEGPTGGDLVYRPELVFIRTERLPEIDDRVVGAPDLVVEIISRGSRRFDSETKKDDYERFGVREYWLIDPEQESMTFFRLVGGRYIEVPPIGNTFPSEAIRGFTLDLARVRQAFRPW